MKQDRGVVNFRVWLEQIVEPSIPEDRLYREVVIESEVAKLANAIEEALTQLSDERPPPSTAQLWESALGAWSRLRPKRGMNGSDLEYRAFAHHMRKLPKALLRAFLTARCPVRETRLRPETRERLLFHLDSWQTSQNFIPHNPEILDYCGGGHVSARDYGLYLWRQEDSLTDGDSVEDGDSPYPAGYRSPREVELDRIMYDRSRSREERQQAADEIARIEWKRLEDQRKRLTDPPKDWLVRPSDGGHRQKGAPYKFNPHKPCQKHEVRGCSRCHPRRNRDRD